MFKELECNFKIKLMIMHFISKCTDNVLCLSVLISILFIFGKAILVSVSWVTFCTSGQILETISLVICLPPIPESWEGAYMNLSVCVLHKQEFLLMASSQGDGNGGIQKIKQQLSKTILIHNFHICPHCFIEYIAHSYIKFR